MYHLFEIHRIMKFMETEVEWWFSLAGELLFNGCRAPVWDDKKKFWKWMVVVAAWQCEFTHYSWNVHWRVVKTCYVCITTYKNNFLHSDTSQLLPSRLTFLQMFHCLHVDLDIMEFPPSEKSIKETSTVNIEKYINQSALHKS